MGKTKIKENTNSCPFCSTPCGNEYCAWSEKGEEKEDEKEDEEQKGTQSS